MGWMIGVLGFDSRRELGIFLFNTASRTALGPIRPPIQWVAGALSLAVKRPWRESDHSPPSNAKGKEWVELYLHSPIRLHGVVKKVKLPLCLTNHHTMKTYWGILDLGTRWRWVVSSTPRPSLPQGKSLRYPLDRRLSGPQSRSGRGGEEKNSQPPLGIEP
jgi:hypothetical protein